MVDFVRNISNTRVYFQAKYFTPAGTYGVESALAACLNQDFGEYSSGTDSTHIIGDPSHGYRLRVEDIIKGWLITRGIATLHFQLSTYSTGAMGLTCAWFDQGDLGGA